MDLAEAGSDRTVGSRGAIAAIVGALVAAISLAAALAGRIPPPAALSVAAMVPAALIDLRERRLPDAWVGASLAVFVVASTIGWAGGTVPDLRGPMLGGLVLCAPILALHLVSPAAMGFGDVKAAAVLGLAVGTVDWQLAVVALTLAAGTAAAIGIAARLRTVPFGPFLVFGAWTALLAADRWLAPWAEGGAIG